MLIDKMIKYVTASTPLRLTIIITGLVSVGSVPIVYLFSFMAGVPYTLFFFVISVLLPLILTPMVVLIIVRLATTMRHVQEHLELELAKNKAKDMMLFEQARFALMGEMMANISHQWKQPLNTINLALLDMKMKSLGLEKKDENFDVIEENINYMATTINDFMSFFDKRSSSEIKDLDTIVHEVKSIVGAHIKNKAIELEIIVDENYGKIEIASSISQVIINLLNNAKDALENSDSKRIRLQFLSNESGLEIECCDEGSGIDDAIKEKVFTPYFTTKAKTQGTGIGLYMSKEIVQKLFQGKINISKRSASRSEVYPFSNEDKTCFFIALPYSDKCRLKEGY